MNSTLFPPAANQAPLPKKMRSQLLGDDRHDSCTASCPVFNICCVYRVCPANRRCMPVFSCMLHSPGTNRRRATIDLSRDNTKLNSSLAEKWPATDRFNGMHILRCTMHSHHMRVSLVHLCDTKTGFSLQHMSTRWHETIADSCAIAAQRPFRLYGHRIHCTDMYVAMWVAIQPGHVDSIVCSGKDRRWCGGAI